MCVTPMCKKDSQGTFVSVPCGSCYECLNKFRQDWFIRLREHAKGYKNKIFVTLTYSDENITYGSQPSLVRRDCQLFFKRLRKKVQRYYSYYLVGEYGSITNRPHYHAIMFGLSKEDEKKINDAWGLGNVMVGNVTDASINYVLKYHISRGNNPEGTERSFSLMSKNIGKDYVNKYRTWHKRDVINRSFYWLDGYKKPLPRYYRDKILSKNDRLKLTIINAKLRDVKMAKESVKESGVNYFKNKSDNIRDLNNTFKRKSGQGGSL